MKLLLLSDSLSIVSIFESRDDKYYFNSIQVDFLFIHKMDDISRIIEILKSTRYHLIVSILNANYLGDFVTKNEWVNAVNNHASESFANFCAEALGESKIDFQPSLVNRTTAYFNVFLDIQKGVSFSGEAHETISLSRLDVRNSLNYIAAYCAAKFHQQYYVLNYCNRLSLETLKALLTKID
jgi:hypothetical protein